MNILQYFMLFMYVPLGLIKLPKSKPVSPHDLLMGLFFYI